jgi:kynurenine formamidase
MVTGGVAETGAVGDFISALGRLRVVDLSPTLYTNMPQWFTHPDVAIVPDARNFQQDQYFLQTLVLPEHSGCHVDAPAHVLQDHASETIDTLPPTVLWGPAKKLDLSDEHWKPGDLLGLDHFLAKAEDERLTIEKGDIVLVQFGWDQYLAGADRDHAKARWWGANMPGFSEDLCQHLGGLGPAAIGTDTAACDLAVVEGKIVTEPQWGHLRDFLPKGILILEGVTNLAAVPRSFYFIALPLKIRGGSGSPLRAIGLVPAL